MRWALKIMLRAYPKGWKGSEIYDELAAVMEDYYQKMELILSTTEDGQAYVDAPTGWKRYHRNASDGSRSGTVPSGVSPGLRS